jgi:hypothetical protein
VCRHEGHGGRGNENRGAAACGHMEWPRDPRWGAAGKVMWPLMLGADITCTLCLQRQIRLTPVLIASAMHIVTFQLRIDKMAKGAWVEGQRLPWHTR